MLVAALIPLLGARPVPIKRVEPPAGQAPEQPGALRPRPAPIGAAPQPSEPTPQPTEAVLHETRALWVSRWDLENTDVQTVVDKAAAAHFNVIFFQVRGTADALYPSDLEPWSAGLTGTLGKDPGYDPLAELIQRAHARGIEVHAWINVYPVWMGKTPPPATAQPTPMYYDFTSRYGDDWLQWRDGQPMRLGQED